MPIHTRSTWTHGLRISWAGAHATLHLTATTTTTTITTTATVVNMDYNKSNWVSKLTALGSTFIVKLNYINPYWNCTQNVKIFILFFKIYFPQYFLCFVKHRLNNYRRGAQAYLFCWCFNATRSMHYALFPLIGRLDYCYVWYIFLDYMLSADKDKIHTSLGVALIFRRGLFFSDEIHTEMQTLKYTCHTILNLNLVYPSKWEHVCVFVYAVTLIFLGRVRSEFTYRNC